MPLLCCPVKPEVGRRQAVLLDRLLHLRNDASRFGFARRLGFTLQPVELSADLLVGLQRGFPPDAGDRNEGAIMDTAFTNG